MAAEKEEKKEKCDDSPDMLQAIQAAMKSDPTLAAASPRRRRDKSYLNRVTFLGRSIGLRATVQPGVHGYRHHANAAPTRKPSAIRDWVTSDLNRSVSFG